MSAHSSAIKGFSQNVYLLWEESKQNCIEYKKAPAKERLYASIECERKFFASADFLYVPELESTIAAPLMKRVKALEPYGLHWIFFMVSEVIFWVSHFNHMNMFLQLLKSQNQLVEYGCRYTIYDRDVVVLHFEDYLISTEKSLLLFLQTYPWDPNQPPQSSKRLILSPVAKQRVNDALNDSSDPVLQKLANIILNLDQQQQNLEAFKGPAFYLFNDHFAVIIMSLYDELVLRKQPPQAATLAVPGMLSILKNWTQLQPKIRSLAHVEFDFLKTLQVIAMAFFETFEQCQKFTEGGYFLRQASLLSMISRKGRFEEITPKGSKESTKIATLLDYLKHAPNVFKKLNVTYKELTSPPPPPEPTRPTTGRKFSGKKGKKKTAAAPSRPTTIRSAPSSSSSTHVEVPSAATTPLDPPHPFIHKIINAKKMIYADRVKRWMKIKISTLEMIRGFQDQGRLDYANQPLEELKNHWDNHAFSHLVDRVMGDADFRSLFTVKTATGRALFAEFQKLPDGIRQRGVVTYGFSGKPKRCYHRHFRPVSNQEILQRQLSEIIASSIPAFEQQEPELEASSLSLAEDLAQGFIGDEFDFDARLNIYRVTDKVHNMRICILPLKTL